MQFAWAFGLGLIRCSAKETTFAIRRALTQNSYLLDFLQRHGILILEYLAVGPQDLLHSGTPGSKLVSNSYNIL